MLFADLLSLHLVTFLMFVILVSIEATKQSEQDLTSQTAHMQNMLPHLGKELPHMLLELKHTTMSSQAKPQN